MTSMTYFVALIGVISLLVIVHELGHYLAARVLGVAVREFSIGFGKPIRQYYSRNGTLYSLRYIVLGGYIKLADEADMQPDFCKRAIILIAGPIANILAAVLLFWIVFAIGFNNQTTVIDKVIADSPAAHAGVQVQQSIIAIDGRAVKTWRDIVAALIVRLGDKGELLLTTNSAEYRLDLSQHQINPVKPDLLASYGFMPREGDIPPAQRFYEHYPAATALAVAVYEVRRFAWVNAVVISKFLTQKISLQSLAGPLTMVKYASTSLNRGLVSFLGFCATLSLAIGLLNFLPLPGLDGGQLLFATIEKLRGKAFNPATHALLYKLTMALLLVVILQLLLFDLIRLWLTA